MKKIALTSLLAMVAVSSANAATNYFVGGSANVSTDNKHATVLAVAPEFGYKMNSDWDLGLDANFGYAHKGQINVTIPGVGVVATDVKTYNYGAGAFARYKVAQVGGVKLLLKGRVGADFTTYSHEKDGAGDKDITETFSSINASIIPMITYDVSEAFTLYANLNFLGVNAGYTFENDNKYIGRDSSWNFGATVNSETVANTGNFQIGFNYNF